MMFGSVEELFGFQLNYLNHSKPLKHKKVKSQKISKTPWNTQGFWKAYINLEHEVDIDWDSTNLNTEIKKRLSNLESELDLYPFEKFQILPELLIILDKNIQEGRQGDISSDAKDYIFHTQKNIINVNENSFKETQRLLKKNYLQIIKGDDFLPDYYTDTKKGTLLSHISPAFIYDENRDKNSQFWWHRSFLEFE